MSRIEYVDTSEENLALVTDLVNEFVIVNWRILDADNNEIPCTKENKLKLMTASPMFTTWAADCLEKMRAGDVEKKEAEEKN